MSWWGLLECELPSVQGFSEITVLSAVSLTESLPFLGETVLGTNVVLKQSSEKFELWLLERQASYSGWCASLVPCM